MAEYREVLSRPKMNIRKGLQQQMLQLIRSHSYPVKFVRPLQVTIDPDDNKFLECADASRADYPLTGSQRHFREILEKNEGDHVPRVH